jgi:hypothetical protein
MSKITERLIRNAMEEKMAQQGEKDMNVIVSIAALAVLVVLALDSFGMLPEEVAEAEVKEVAPVEVAMAEPEVVEVAESDVEEESEADDEGEGEGSGEAGER